ncbi:MAG: hypothetical protein H7329_14120 [Opitutaceae bacterium]|nr:hypothetical protein [Cytophagales bacterium]
MKSFNELYSSIDRSKSASQLLNTLLKNKVHWHLPNDTIINPLSIEEFLITQKRIKELLQSQKDKKCKLLFRGEFKARLIFKLNGDNYSKVFSIGEKAQNYLGDIGFERDAFEKINDVSQKTMEWIFSSYSEIQLASENIKTYFRQSTNKQDFVNKLIGNEKFRDYYLYGLQTEGGSSRKVFFVSSSTSPQQSLFNESNKILFLFWIPEPHSDYAQSKTSLKQIHKEIEAKDLPILKDSCFPKENEYSIKGAIFPDFLYAIIDVDHQKIIINPKLLETEISWITNGLDIHPEDFKSQFHSSSYKRFVRRYSSGEYLDN